MRRFFSAYSTMGRGPAWRFSAFSDRLRLGLCLCLRACVCSCDWPLPEHPWPQTHAMPHPDNPGSSPAPQKPFAARITDASPCGKQASKLTPCTTRLKLTSIPSSIQQQYASTLLLGNSCAGAGQYARFFQHLLRRCQPRPNRPPLRITP